MVTSTSPPHLVQSTVVVLNGNAILVDVFAEGGPVDVPGSLVATVGPGALPADT